METKGTFIVASSIFPCIFHNEINTNIYLTEKEETSRQET